MVEKHKCNWNHFLFSSLWAYQTSTKTNTSFTPFHLVHGVDLVLPIEFEISSLRLVTEPIPDTSPLEHRLLTLEWTNEGHRTTLQIIEVAKTRLKSLFDSHIHPCIFREGDLVLVYDQTNDKLSKGKFDSMWYDPYLIHWCLGKGAYILSKFYGHLLMNPRNGLYLKRFYS